MNEQKTDLKQKFQICVSGGRVMEYNMVEESYLPRKWHRFENIKEFRKFVRSKAFDKIFVDEDSEMLVITQDETNKLLFSSVAPKMNLGEDIQEYVFDTENSVKEFISKNNLSPSSNLLDDASKEQINRFFSGEKCFFENAAQLYVEYKAQKDRLEASDSHGEVLLGKKYEQKIVDILIKY